MLRLTKEMPAAVWLGVALAVPLVYASIAAVRHRNTPSAATGTRSTPEVTVSRVPCDDPSRSLFDRGLCFINENNPSAALLALQPVASADPRNVIVHNNLCVAHNMLGQWRSGIEACRHAIEVDPDYQRARNNLAWAESERDKALKTLPADERAARAQKDSQALRTVGMAYFNAGGLEQSLAAWQAALAIEPQSDVNQNNVAVALIALQRYDEATRFLEAALARDPQNQLYKNNLQWALNEKTAARGK